MSSEPAGGRQDEDSANGKSTITIFNEKGWERKTYHKYHDGKYPYPNNDEEIDRLDLQHHLTKLLTKGRLFTAPLKSPRRILDVGAGSGIWVMEMAPHFPDADILGIDLSLIDLDPKPRNVYFSVEDVTEPDWVCKHAQFDYIRAANMSGAFSSFEDVLKKMLDRLKPGGWVEWHEFDPMPKCDDGTMPPLYAYEMWLQFQELAARSSPSPRKYCIAHLLRGWMEDVGFVDVKDEIVKAPLTPWPEDQALHDIGRYNQLNVMEAIPAWSYKPFKSLNWDDDKIRSFVREVQLSLCNYSIHSYMNFHVVTGRKPYPKERPL